MQMRPGNANRSLCTDRITNIYMISYINLDVLAMRVNVCDLFIFIENADTPKAAETNYLTRMCRVNGISIRLILIISLMSLERSIPFTPKIVHIGTTQTTVNICYKVFDFSFNPVAIVIIVEITGDHTSIRVIIFSRPCHISNSDKVRWCRSACYRFACTSHRHLKNIIVGIALILQTLNIIKCQSHCRKSVSIISIQATVDLVTFLHYLRFSQTIRIFSCAFA